jgi:hypothetical protein
VHDEVRNLRAAFDVAKRCSTMSREASNFGVSAFARVRAPVLVSASNNVDGVKKPLTDMNAPAPVRSPSATSTDTLSGTFSGRADHPPRTAGV